MWVCQHPLHPLKQLKARGGGRGEVTGQETMSFWHSQKAADRSHQCLGQFLACFSCQNRFCGPDFAGQPECVIPHQTPPSPSICPLEHCLASLTLTLLGFSLSVCLPVGVYLFVYTRLVFTSVCLHMD